MRDLHSTGLRLLGKQLEILDQRLLPHEEHWLLATDPKVLAVQIQALAIRGAPLLGVAAALALGIHAEAASDGEIRENAALLRRARPTAVNLMHAIDRLLKAFATGTGPALTSEAFAIFDEDIALCEGMAERGAALVADGDGILTHCNTGGLATAGIGTALGVIRRAHEQGKRIHVYMDETRPLLQGARLTAWELQRLQIPCTLLCDNMAGALLRTGRVKKIFVGADRISANGDVANKIGTYGLAVLAHFHKVPFYVVAPSTTLDPHCPNGQEIPIEQRAPEEVRGGQAPGNVEVWNPAFDFTPRALITNIILEDRLL